MAPKAPGAVVGEGEGSVGKKAECAMVASVGEWRRGAREPPSPDGPSVGVSGDMSAVRFIASGTITDNPGAPFLSDEGTFELELLLLLEFPDELAPLLLLVFIPVDTPPIVAVVVDVDVDDEAPMRSPFMLLLLLLLLL